MDFFPSCCQMEKLGFLKKLSRNSHHVLSLNADPSLLLSSSPLLWPPDHGQHYGLIHHTDGREFGKYVP